MRDPHQVLGVPWNADPRHIRAAYRKRAAEFHPDRNSEPDAAERLKEVVEAYRFLSNPSRYVQDQDDYQAAASGGAASVSTAEFRRQQTFWYHFQKLIAPRESRWLPAHATRCRLAIVFSAGLTCLFLFDPACAQMRMPDTGFDEFIIVGLLLASTIVIVCPYLFAEIPLYTNRRGLEPSVPEWLVESYGWIGLLSILVMIAVGSRFFGFG
jgi:hypothetical protein